MALAPLLSDPSRWSEDATTFVRNRLIDDLTDDPNRVNVPKQIRNLATARGAPVFDQPQSLADLQQQHEQLQRWGTKFGGTGNPAIDRGDNDIRTVRARDSVSREAYDRLADQHDALREELHRIRTELERRQGIDQSRAPSYQPGLVSHETSEQRSRDADEIARLQRHLDEVNSKLLQKQRQATEMESHLSELQNRYDILGHHVLQLGEEKTSLMEALRERQSQLDLCLAQMQILGRDSIAYQKLQKRIALLEAEIEALRKENEDLRRKLLGQRPMQIAGAVPGPMAGESVVHTGLILRVRWSQKSGLHSFGSRYLTIDTSAGTLSWYRRENQPATGFLSLHQVRRIAFGRKSRIASFKKVFVCPEAKPVQSSSSGSEADLPPTTFVVRKGLLDAQTRLSLVNCFSIEGTDKTLDFFTATENEAYIWMTKFHKVFKNTIPGTLSREEFLLERVWARCVEVCCRRQITARQLLIEAMEKAASFARQSGIDTKSRRGVVKPSRSTARPTESFNAPPPKKAIAEPAPLPPPPSPTQPTAPKSSKMIQTEPVASRSEIASPPAITKSFAQKKTPMGDQKPQPAMQKPMAIPSPRIITTPPPAQIGKSNRIEPLKSKLAMFSKPKPAGGIKPTGAVSPGPASAVVKKRTDGPAPEYKPSQPKKKMAERASLVMKPASKDLGKKKMNTELDKSRPSKGADVSPKGVTSPPGKKRFGSSLISKKLTQGQGIKKSKFKQY